jgi:hypothetical protein
VTCNCNVEPNVKQCAKKFLAPWNTITVCYKESLSHFQIVHHFCAENIFLKISFICVVSWKLLISIGWKTVDDLNCWETVEEVSFVHIIHQSQSEEKSSISRQFILFETWKGLHFSVCYTKKKKFTRVIPACTHMQMLKKAFNFDCVYKYLQSMLSAGCSNWVGAGAVTVL